LLDHIAAKRKPIILSTGMNDLSSVRKSVATIAKHGTPLALMHCTSMYPTPYAQVRLGAVSELQTAFPGMPIGLSDHSLNIWTCLGAVALGASMLEKHFTISRSWPGPDTGISIEPDDLARLIEGSHAIWLARGGSKTRLAEEQSVIDFAYATVVTIAPIRAGEAFTLKNTGVKRPGTGKLLAERLSSVLGKKAARDLPTDVHVDPSDVVGL